MLTKVELPQGYKRLINKEKEKKDVLQIIDEEGYLREVSFDDLTSHPTTLAGYGITDAYISNGTIYLGNQSITPASVSSLGTAAYKDYTASVIQGSTDLPTSDAVFQAIGAAVSSALHYRGISSTIITDGGTETVVIDGQPLVVQSGDVVIYSGFEFLWENNVWNKLGDDTSFALKTVQITGDGIYITGGGDLTTSRSLGLSQAAIDALTLASTALQSVAFSDLTSHPTTLSGYGITDAKIANGVITLGSNTITPLTSFTETDPVFSASAAAGITTNNITTWNGKYTKPSTGIPKTDLESDVQTSLGLADTALQSVAFSDLTSHPTTLAGYGITDAIPYSEILSTVNAFDDRRLWLHEVSNTFWAANLRYDVTATGFRSGKAAYLFDGSFDSMLQVAPGGTGVITIAGKDGSRMWGGGYPYGYLEIAFYYLAIPESVSVRVYSDYGSQTGWRNISMTNVSRQNNRALYRGFNNGVYGVTTIEITVVAKESSSSSSYNFAGVTQVSFFQNRGTLQQMAVFNKSIAQTLYYDLTAPKYIVTGGTSSQFLKADGSLDSNIYALSSALGSYVPTSRKVNNKALSADITLNLDDVADGSTRKLSNYVPTTRTINSKTLSSDITLTLDDVSDGSTRKLYKTITIQSATEGQYTKETLATLFGVSSSDLSLILDGECYVDYSGVKYSPATARKWDDSSLSVTEYSVVDRDWDLEKWYLNDITILGYGGAIALIVKTRVYIATEEAAAHMSFTTYSELVTLKNNGGLVPGRWYGINDYEATTTDTESRSNGHKFGVCVLATSSDTLSEECLAYRSTDSYYSESNLEAWKVRYTVDNDTTRFSWADETNGKGVIYRLIDEWGNDLPYDFKSIQFKRYKVTAASANPELQVLNGLYLGLQSNSKGLTTDTSDYKWFYTFSQLGDDWTTDATDASLKIVNNEVATRTVFGPKVTSNEVTQVLNNVVMMNGALVQTFLEAHGTQSDYEDSVSTDFLGGSSKVNDITTFGNFGNVNVTGCFRWNIFVGITRHLDFKTDCQNNTVACFDDFCFNTFDDGFNNNVIVTTEAITQNRFGEYFQNNVINIIGYIKQNEFGPTFYNNKIYCSIVNNTFGPSVHDNTFGTLGEARSNYIQRNVFGPTVYHCSFKSFFMLNRIYGQITYCNFGSYVAANTIDPILQYVDIPDGTSSTMFRGAHIHGGIRGTSTAHIALDSSEFRGSVSGVTRAIDIEGDADGKIVATWYSSQKRVGIYKAVADTSWTALPDEIGDINTILSSI